MKILAPSFALVVLLSVGIVGSLGVYQFAYSQANADPVSHDAGPAGVVYLDGSGPVVAPPADAPPALPDPIAAPGEAASQVWNLYKAGTLVPAIILGVFFLFVAVRSKVAWLRTGNRAAVTAAALVAVTMLAERASAGATPNLSMVLGALMAGVLLYVRGDKAAEA